MRIRVAGNRLSFHGFEFTCATGKGGFSLNKREGDGCTPIGTFAMRECWYRADRVPAPVTGLPLKIIGQDDGWSDDPASREYNTHIKLPLPAGEGRGEGFDTYPKPEIIQKSRELRQASTTPEQLLWQMLRNRQLLGYKFRRQHPVPSYIADFCCEEAKLIVEVDGESHFTDESKIRDKKRTYDMQQLGYRVMRFTNHEVMSNREGVFEALTLNLSHRERGFSYEKLWRDDHVYNYIIPMGYNDNPVVAGLGSAIFMHLAHPDYRPTEGCVALQQADLLAILPHIDTQTLIEITEN